VSDEDEVTESLHNSDTEQEIEEEVGEASTNVEEQSTEQI
jgi:hypothetical protein